LSIEKQGIDTIVCLGDLVGYGADPDYCVEIIRQKAEVVVVGNHDHAAIGATSVSDFNHFARQAAIWTAKTLTSENKEYLKNLEFRHIYQDLLLVHSTPLQPEEWNYIFSLWEAQEQFDYFTQTVCFIGHSHVPAQFRESKSDRMIVNVGSVGQPRDGDPRACYYIYDTINKKGDWMRVNYPIKDTVAKILAAGLPEPLAERLKYGW
jgi:diadenosine tetraphosphatase ApaH/serine/threonine PP2A family protein phosphatase